MQIINNQNVGNAYTDAATIQNVINSNGGYFLISNNDVFVELQYNIQGQLSWTKELHVPVGSGQIYPNTCGIRFRNFVAGSVAVLSAAVSENKEPSISIGSSGVATASGGGSLVIGEVKFFANSGNPDATKFLFCDGSAISRATFAALFTAIGTTFGAGDGVTTFNLPDTMGRMLVGLANVGGNAAVKTLGGNDGTLLANRQPKHNHTATASLSAAVSHNSGAAAGATVSDDSQFAAGNLINVPVVVGPGGTTTQDAPSYLVLGAYICYAT